MESLEVKYESRHGDTGKREFTVLKAVDNGQPFREHPSTTTTGSASAARVFPSGYQGQKHFIVF
jgi:hypothetical protein